MTIRLYSCQQIPVNKKKKLIFESPDFIMLSDGKKYGLEVRQSTLKEMERDKNILARNPEYAFIEHNGPDGHYLRKHGEPMSGKVYRGNEDIQRITNIVIKGIDDKMKKLNGQHFEKCDFNELILLDTYGLVIDSRENRKYNQLLDMLSSQISEHLKKVKTEFVFDRISLIKNGKLLFDLNGRAILLEKAYF